MQIEITKVSVSEQMDKLWNITLNLKCLDNTVEVINQNFSVRYRPGQDAEAKVKSLLAEMQETIDDYKAEQQILNHVKLDTAVIWLQSKLEG